MRPLTNKNKYPGEKGWECVWVGGGGKSVEFQQTAANSKMLQAI
jgi:hypothetical protein